MMVDQILNKLSPAEKKAKNRELPVRSVVKSLSWRVLGTLDTILISWWISGDFTVAFSIGSFELITKTVLYFFHERFWTRIKWGNN